MSDPYENPVQEYSPATEEKRSAAQALIEPVQPSERIHTLDVLRGFALFGILFVNVTALSQPGDWFGVAWQELGPVNYAVEVFKLFFTQGKFYTLFAFLFGLGFAVQLTRAEQRGGRFAGRFFWRVTLLFVIGVLHIVFLWDGDILNTYAVGGVLLLMFFGMKRGIDRLLRRFSKGRREKAPRWIILMAAAILIFGPLTAFGLFVDHAMDVREAALAGEELSEFDQDVWEQVQKADDPERVSKHDERIASVNKTFAEGSYVDTVSYRMEQFGKRVLSGPFWFMIAGIFMIGAYFGRNNFIGRAAELRSGFNKLMIISLLTGIPLSAWFVYVSIAGHGQSQISWWPWLNFFTKTASGLAFALFYVAAVTLLMQTRARGWLEYLAPVGRTALSNYLLQSLIGTTVFYGYGFGLTGKLDALAQVGYIVVLFAFQMWLSKWWLARFRFGPVEWLWRSLTYFKRQPMRLSNRNGAPFAGAAA